MYIMYINVGVNIYVFSDVLFKNSFSRELYSDLYSSPCMYYCGDEIMGDEMGWTCGAYGEERKYIRDCGR
jgi:hypothetical protein